MADTHKTASAATKPANDMRTPLARVLHLGSAKSGTQDHIRQRLTAVAIAPLSLFFLVLLVALTGADYETARSWLANPLVGILALCLIVAAIIHMRIGMQIVIEDYVIAPGLKHLSILANTFFSYGVGLACLYAVLKLAFGS
ncbi:Succinate dehydrogenase hydrophobic membrane anchor [Parvibaculum lavamentivorans DS-1]|uniref:Succinate dehydrogenase hydrophobic membrane anchor subunit n=1 Tax=Parvibaculum lavamentivorans (strain DS-1 / DSM 13023 / NCIMB 13966) TaxID=402881 RepID=A7HT21_PARL1|nr:succinate dehydrogenase, hydrophobic membrane anchor protein [Parvibaculum lavamentivorans]ABS63054.1 Succinate dehydrogenase hydrophobic membrane anchor [Parvibaculum lavamentivorans DS-1]